jgi:4-amino-4-deoxy-L-arabinose transferase-like glycosyltransferase
MARRAILAVLLALGGGLFFVDLGGTSIWDANEAFYVETPREMLEAHDLVNPSFDYEPRFNKPILSYWIVAGFYKLLGVSVTVQRLPIAIGALVIVACAFLLAGAAASTGPSPRGAEPNASLLAATGLAVSPRLVMFARRIFIDIWITAFMSLTLVFFALSERYPDRRRLFLILMYAAAGLGTLTKGPVAIVLPALAFGLYLLVHRELRRLATMMLPLGVLIVAAIVVPWYAVVYEQHGWSYIKVFFIGENFSRYTSGVGLPQERGPLFYPPIVLTDSFPLSFFLVPAAALWWRERARRGAVSHGAVARTLLWTWTALGPPARRIQTLLWIWIAVIVLFFSFSANKQDLYIYPIVPAVAALGGAFAARAAGDPAGPLRRWASVTAGVAGIFLAAAGAGVLYVFETAGRVYALDGAIPVGIIGLLGGLAAAALAVWRRPLASLLALMIVLAMLDWTFVLRVLPDFERYKPVPGISRTLQARLQPGDVVAVFHEAVPSLVYYLRRHVDMYIDAGAFVDAMSQPRRTYGVVTLSDYDELRPRIRRRTCVIDRHPTFDVRLKNVLARDPPPELLLITNECG